MNQVINSSFWTSDKFWRDIVLRQFGFVYKAWGSFRKTDEKVKQNKETREQETCLHKQSLLLS